MASRESRGRPVECQALFSLICSSATSLYLMKSAARQNTEPHSRGRTTSTSSVLTTSEVTFFQRDFQPATVAERLKEQRGTITGPHVPAHFPKLREIRGRSLHSFVPFWLGDSPPLLFKVRTPHFVTCVLSYTSVLLDIPELRTPQLNYHPPPPAFMPMGFQTFPAPEPG